jgi:hypothetical protein
MGALKEDVGPARLRVGVVVERKVSAGPWGLPQWRVTDLLIGGGPEAAPQTLAAGPGWERFYAGTLEIRLFRDAIAGYLHNLASAQPVVYGILRPDEEGDGMHPFHLTVCPVEAQDYLVGGAEIVETAPMPAAVAAWVQAFVDRHPQPEPFRKRRQTAKTAEGSEPQACGAERAGRR